MYLEYHLPEKGFSILEFAKPGIFEPDTIIFDLNQTDKATIIFFK